MDALPEWEPGTVATLSVGGAHAIPVSTAVRSADSRLMFALGASRDTLRRLREDPRAALCMLARGVAFTAAGTATVVRSEMRSAPHVTALELSVEHLQDHLAGARTEILDAVRWRFTQQDAAEADAAVRAELLEMGETVERARRALAHAGSWSSIGVALSVRLDGGDLVIRYRSHGGAELDARTPADQAGDLWERWNAGSIRAPGDRPAS